MARKVKQALPHFRRRRGQRRARAGGLSRRFAYAAAKVGSTGPARTRPVPEQNRRTPPERQAGWPSPPL